MREQEALKPLFDRAVSAAEPGIPSEPQVERNAHVLALAAEAAFRDLRQEFKRRGVA